MPDLITAAASAPDLATINSWPALAAYALGALALGYGQWRQSRVTKDVRHQVSSNGGGSMKDQTDRIESKLDQHIADAPGRVWRARREAAAFATVAALLSVALTLTKTRRF